MIRMAEPATGVSLSSPPAKHRSPSLGFGTTISFLADAEGSGVGFLARDAGNPERRLPTIR